VLTVFASLRLNPRRARFSSCAKHDLAAAVAAAAAAEDRHEILHRVGKTARTHVRTCRCCLAACVTTFSRVTASRDARRSSGPPVHASHRGEGRGAHPAAFPIGVCCPSSRPADLSVLSRSYAARTERNRLQTLASLFLHFSSRDQRPIDDAVGSCCPSTRIPSRKRVQRIKPLSSSRLVTLVTAFACLQANVIRRRNTSTPVSSVSNLLTFNSSRLFTILDSSLDSILTDNVARIR